MIPAGAVKLLPILVAEAALVWPQYPTLSVVAGQIEKESLWKVEAKLQTKRELGRGLSQFTIAYREDGSVRFNAIAELKAQHRELLKDWTEANVYDPRLNMRAMLLKNRGNYLATNGAEDHIERSAFMLCKYNAGAGLCEKDRVLCANTHGCNPAKWFAHVESQGYQSKTRWQGYGQSAFDITRGYVRQVMLVKRHKYVPYTGQ